MSGIIINDLNTEELGLILTDFVVSSPDSKVNFLDIPGADGSLDLTEALSGRVTYKDRNLSFSFVLIDKGIAIWNDVYQRLLQKIHGQEVKVFTSYEEKYFFEGRAQVSSNKVNQVYSTINIEVLAHPYMLSIYASAENYLWGTFNFETDYANELQEVVINKEKEVTIAGEQMVMNPTITSDAEMFVDFLGMTYKISIGEKKYYSINLIEGVNILKFRGNGTIKISVRGGKL